MQLKKLAQDLFHSKAYNEILGLKECVLVIWDLWRISSFQNNNVRDSKISSWFQYVFSFLYLPTIWFTCCFSLWDVALTRLNVRLILTNYYTLLPIIVHWISRSLTSVLCFSPNFQSYLQLSKSHSILIFNLNFCQQWAWYSTTINFNSVNTYLINIFYFLAPRFTNFAFIECYCVVYSKLVGFPFMKTYSTFVNLALSDPFNLRILFKDLHSVIS